MFKRVIGFSLAILAVATGAFFMIYGKALFWSSTIAAKLELAVQGGVCSILGWVLLFVGIGIAGVLSTSKKLEDIVKDIEK